MKPFTNWVVLRYVHPYDTSRRPLHSLPAETSATPIYDALYAEYVKSFRALPGDRSGEDQLEFTAFGHAPGHGYGYGYASPNGGGFGGPFGGSTYSAYSAGAQSARQQGQWQRVGTLGQQQTSYAPYGTYPVPAALPPAPRRGY